jgi:transposase
VDAAHFVWAPFLGFLWSWYRLFVPAASGRKRFNVLGAIHAKTHRLVTVTNDSYINSQSICELLEKIAGIGYSNPITLIMDNAAYQHARIVKARAKAFGIEILYLPAYSPNLNLIERLWKFVKKKCLYSKYYETFFLFKAAISECLEKVGESECEQELQTLLALNFQSFINVQIV